VELGDFYQSKSLDREPRVEVCHGLDSFHGCDADSQGAGAGDYTDAGALVVVFRVELVSGEGVSDSLLGEPEHHIES